jgi:16S rRNA (uracil1498-N3)-methyltransferase
MKPRFYLPQAFIPQQEFIAPATLHKHLQVLRLKAQDEVILFDGQGGQISARILDITKKVTRIGLLDDFTVQPVSALKLHLGQGLCRADRMDIILQKSVELNVSEITPLYVTRSQGRLTGTQLEHKMHHWQEIIINACAQCAQNHLPRLHAPIILADWLPQSSADVQLQFALTQALSLKTVNSTPRSCALLIGPEGGLTDEETALADRHHFKRISLGARILRVETAAILALGLVNYHFDAQFI